MVKKDYFADLVYYGLFLKQNYCNELYCYKKIKIEP